MYETAEYQTPESFFVCLFETSRRSQKMQQVSKSYKEKNTSHFPGFPGTNPKPRMDFFLIFLFSFVRCKPSGLGPAWQRRVPAGGRGPGAGPVAPETAGNFPPPRPRQCRGRPGGRPIGGAWTPLREGAPNPHGWSHPPHPRASGGADPQPPRRPSPALRSPRPVPQREWSREPPGVPVPAPLCAGAEQGGADETPVRPRRARPRAPQLTGTGRAAGHYSIADSAAAPWRRRRRPRPGSPRPADRGSRSGKREAAAAAAGAAGGAGGAGRGLPERREPARGGGDGSEAREPSAAQEGAGDHVPRGGGRSDARCSDDPARRRRARAPGNPNTSTGNRNPD